MANAQIFDDFQDAGSGIFDAGSGYKAGSGAPEEAGSGVLHGGSGIRHLTMGA